MTCYQQRHHHQSLFITYKDYRIIWGTLLFQKCWFYFLFLCLTMLTSQSMSHSLLDHLLSRCLYPSIVIGTFFNYLDFPTHYICGTMNFKKPTHDSWQRDAGYEDSLQSKSPVVDQHLFFILTLIHGQAGGGCWLLHVRERTDWWGPSPSSPAASSRSTHLHLPVSQSLFTFIVQFWATLPLLVNIFPEFFLDFILKFSERAWNTENMFSVKICVWIWH